MKKHQTPAINRNSVVNNSTCTDSHSSRTRAVTEGIQTKDAPPNDNNNLEILSLNSSSSEEEYYQISYSHLWKYVNNVNIIDADNIENNQCHYNETYRNEYNGNLTNDSVYDQENYNGNLNHDMTYSVQQTNCYTIFTNHCPLNAAYNSSSSEECADVEVVQCGEALSQNCNGREPYDRVITTHGSNERDKPSILIYSFHNEDRVLTECDFEMINIPSSDTMTSTYSSDSDTHDFDGRTEGKVNRVATPVPTCVPRFNLTLPSTLPTVTEIREVRSSNTEGSQMSSRRNNWVNNENDHSNVTDTSRSNKLNGHLTPKERLKQINKISEENLMCKENEGFEAVVHKEHNITQNNVSCQTFILLEPNIQNGDVSNNSTPKTYDSHKNRNQTRKSVKIQTDVNKNTASVQVSSDDIDLENAFAMYQSERQKNLGDEKVGNRGGTEMERVEKYNYDQSSRVMTDKELRSGRSDVDESTQMGANDSKISSGSKCAQRKSSVWKRCLKCMTCGSNR